MAVLLRLCDEDREKWGGPEWVRFDDGELDDVDSVTLSGYEADMGATFAELYAVDRRRESARWKTVEVWLARRMAGVENTPVLPEFKIKIRKVERKEEPTATAEGGDADPPDSSSPSTAAGRSKKDSR